MKFLRKKNFARYFTICVLILSIFINVICLLPYVGYYIERISEHYCPTQYYAKDASDSVVIAQVLKASIQMDGSEFSCAQPQRGLIYDVHQFFKPTPSANYVNNYSKAFLYAGLSEYALTYKDTSVVSFLKKDLDAFIQYDRLTYKLQVVDQVPIGIAYINLYKVSGDKKYLAVATSIYRWLIGKRNASNIIYYRDSPNQFVDALAMYVPFLVEYSKVANDSVAYHIAKDNMAEFYKYGVDKETGIPSHGYNKKTHLKVGSTNWGRGIGWYVLSLSYMQDIKNTALDKMLPMLQESQFPQSSTELDSSTALMFEIYMQCKGIHQHSINFIKPYITQEGKIMNCSGDTYDFNNHSRILGPAELTQGLFLLLVSHNRQKRL